mmetsp:Transcript_86959/g.242083  ORF Transcript_86959/g.242083 Transcript_86959/m.242083 type:complete len:238 (-) Transcript_86959:539-1252(-)
MESPARPRTWTRIQSRSIARRHRRRLPIPDGKSALASAWKAAASRCSTEASTSSTRPRRDERCSRAASVRSGRTATTRRCASKTIAIRPFAARGGASSTLALAPWNTRKSQTTSSRAKSEVCPCMCHSPLARPRMWRRRGRPKWQGRCRRWRSQILCQMMSHMLCEMSRSSCRQPRLQKLPRLFPVCDLAKRRAMGSPNRRDMASKADLFPETTEPTPRRRALLRCRARHHRRRRAM